MLFFIIFGLIAQYFINILLLILGILSIHFFNQNIKIFDSHNDNENTDKLLKLIKDTSINLNQF